MSRTTRILIALAAGLLIGATWRRLQLPGLAETVTVAEVIGGLWVDALRMTIVPLVFGLIVTGFAAAAASAHAGGLAARALGLFAALLAGAAAVTALLAPLMVGFWVVPAGLAESLGASPLPAIPPVSEMLRTLIPTNVVAAAAEGAIVPLVIFGLLFGIAAARLPDRRGDPVIAMFRAVTDTMLVIVHWILWLAPVGVFALTLAVGSRLGVGAGAALLYYIAMQIMLALVLILLLYPVVAIAGKVKVGDFARAIAPAQAVAASTQSSLASLPPMLESAGRLGIRPAISSVALPLAVSVFRITSTTSIIIVTLALARLYGIALGPAELVVVALLSIVGSLAIVGVSSQASFVAATAPAALAVGVPIELLPILLAVDAIPDMFRTVANVTADMAATAILDRTDGRTSADDQAAELRAATIESAA